MKLKKIIHLFSRQSYLQTNTNNHRESLNTKSNEVVIESDNVDEVDLSEEFLQRDFNQSDNRLSIILQEISSLKKIVQEIKDEVENNSKELHEVKNNVDNISNELENEVKKNLMTLENEVKKNSKELEEIKVEVVELRTENGHIFEMIARNEIAKKHGQRYSEGFEVFDLNGLVRLSAPKLKLPSEGTEV